MVTRQVADYDIVVDGGDTIPGLGTKKHVVIGRSGNVAGSPAYCDVVTATDEALSRARLPTATFSSPLVSDTSAMLPRAVLAPSVVAVPLKLAARSHRQRR